MTETRTLQTPAWEMVKLRRLDGTQKDVTATNSAGSICFSSADEKTGTKRKAASYGQFFSESKTELGLLSPTEIETHTAQLKKAIALLNAASNSAENANDAFVLFHEFANKPHANPIAQYFVGKCFFDGIGVKQNFYEAVNWLRPSALCGFHSAQFLLGQCYQHSFGVAFNFDTALQWYLRAAEQHNHEAEFELGCIHQAGKYLQQDFIEAAHYLERAAQGGHDESQFLLAMCYYENKGVRFNYARAKEWAVKSGKYTETKFMTTYPLPLAKNADDSTLPAESVVFTQTLGDGVSCGEWHTNNHVKKVVVVNLAYNLAISDNMFKQNIFLSKLNKANNTPECYGYFKSDDDWHYVFESFPVNTDILKEEEEKRQLPSPIAASQIVLARQIGKGNFSKVYLGHLHTETGNQEVAVKVITDEDVTRDKFLAEVENLYHLKSPFVTQIVGYCFAFHDMCLIEFLPQNNLYIYLKTMEFTPENHYRIVCDIAVALHHIHSMNVIHNDLNPENYFVRQDRIILGDFGEAFESTKPGDGRWQQNDLSKLHIILRLILKFKVGNYFTNSDESEMDSDSEEELELSDERKHPLYQILFELLDLLLENKGPKTAAALLDFLLIKSAKLFHYSMPAKIESDKMTDIVSENDTSGSLRP